MHVSQTCGTECQDYLKRKIVIVIGTKMKSENERWWECVWGGGGERKREGQRDWLLVWGKQLNTYSTDTHTHVHINTLHQTITVYKVTVLYMWWHISFLFYVCQIKTSLFPDDIIYYLVLCCVMYHTRKIELPSHETINYLRSRMMLSSTFFSSLDTIFICYLMDYKTKGN